MARTIFRDDGQGNPVGKVNIEVRSEDANWFRKRRRVTSSGAMEPLYSVVWRFIELFEHDKEEVLRIVDESEQKTKTIAALYERIDGLEAELKLARQGKFVNEYGNTGMMV